MGPVEGGSKTYLGEEMPRLRHKRQVGIWQVNVGRWMGIDFR